MRGLLLRGGIALLGTLAAGGAHAAEGGTGHYMPGALATIIDLPPTQPGWVVEAAGVHYDADVSFTLPVAGLTTAGLDVEVDVFLLGGFYTFELPTEGLFYSLGGFAPWVWVEAEASVQTPFGSVSRRDTASGLGDVTLIPAMLAWKRVQLPIYAPTGDYEEGELANPGLNYWTFDPTIGAAYNNEKIGFNAALHLGVAFNTENPDTDYRSGHLFHAEASLQQLLPLGSGFVGVGAEAFFLDQITGDSGSGARLGDFERRSWGVGPVLSYVLPRGGHNFVAELRWLPELGTERQLEGDYVWLKLVYQF
ncbi:MAG: transporter [Gemmatimonadota bacterium]|nr:transporter [Gemmatimonadota bacterium]